MEQNSLVVVEQPQNVQTESVLIIEQFLNDNYHTFPRKPLLIR